MSRAPEVYDPHGAQPDFHDMPERAYPHRLERVTKWVAVIVAVGVACVIWWWFISNSTPAPTMAGIAVSSVPSALGGAMAYACARGAGMIVVGVYGLSQHAKDINPDWKGLRDDFSQRETWVQILETVLLFATMGGFIWALIEAVRHLSPFAAAMTVLLAAMMWWPLIRHRLRFGRWPY